MNMLGVSPLVAAAVKTGIVVGISAAIAGMALKAAGHATPAPKPETVYSLCQIGPTDGYLVRELSGELHAYVMVDGRLWREGEFLPCRLIPRNRHA